MWSQACNATWLKFMIVVPQTTRRANAHHLKKVSCDLGVSRPFYGRFSVQK